MITWKNFAARSGAATTTWNYDANRGFLISKVYDDGRGTTNTYTPAGRLRIRTWARGITTTYGTNAAGEVVGLTYSDNTTSNVVYTLDRLGRRTGISDGAGSRFLTYTDTGQILMETNASGTLVGFSLTNGYDALLRRTTLALRSNATALLTHAFAYDGAARLTNVSDGTYSATYSYLANSPLVSQIMFRSNSTTRMTTTKQYDFLNRLLAISNVPSVDTALAYSYVYNDANQRTRCTMPDGSYWLYEYDALGQLTSGKHYWPDDAPVAGQQFEYGFDDIGNRTSTKAGGDQNGGGLHAASYTANSLNQYTQRDVPGAADISGAAHAQASVSVNGNSNVYRRGEYFWKDLSINNASAAVWQSVTNRAVLTNATNTVMGNLFLPKTPEAFAYDRDGNLTNDGRWMLTWDAENRLVKMESYSAAPTASKRRISYTYDSQSRLVRRALEDGSSGSYVVTNDQKLLWNDWLCLADLKATNNTIERSYLWGLDLSGSLQGAGGIGGLLTIGDKISGLTSFAAYDGNGNLTALASGTDGSPSARYEYDPFGRTLRATGPMASANPMRFSTKRADDTADLAYYGYRYYNSSIGRWLSRDPIGIRGGRNCCAFVDNAPLLGYDALGLLRDICGPKCRATVTISRGLWWTTPGFQYSFTVDATYNNLNTWGNFASCCAYVQYIMYSAASVNGLQPNSDANNVPVDRYFHVDTTAWTSASDVIPPIPSYADSDPSPERFVCSDYPGMSLNFSAGDVIDYRVQILSTVVDVCNDYRIVAADTLSISATGTWPSLNYVP